MEGGVALGGAGVACGTVGGAYVPYPTHDWFCTSGGGA